MRTRLVQFSVLGLVLIALSFSSLFLEQRTAGAFGINEASVYVDKEGDDTGNTRQFFGPSETQIHFDAGWVGGPLYITSLRVCGTNQYNSVACWPGNNPQTWSSGQRYVPIYGWWWKLDQGLSLNFYLQGYGQRSCYVRMDRPFTGYPNTIIVQYQGGGQCFTRTP